ncbi:MAG: flagellar export protein FliJ [Clostridiales bacterium]|jgi:flagellar FliJ protein|nr:flagellar export protein FliJ [Clostridiales bacterium]
MAKFHFQLKTLLDLHRQLEEQAKNKLGAAVAEFNRELMRLDGIKSAIALTVDEFRALSGGRFAAGKIRGYNAFLSMMKERAEAQALVVSGAEERVALARRELLAAAQEHDMYEKLREKAYAKYLDDEKRAEQRVADEIISYRIGSGVNGEEREGG